MVELTTEELYKLKKDCEDDLEAHPLIIDVLDAVKKEIKDRLELQRIYFKK